MIRIKGGHVVDPVNGRDGPGDLWINGDRIVDAPTDGRAVETVEVDEAYAPLLSCGRAHGWFHRLVAGGEPSCTLDRGNLCACS